MSGICATLGFCTSFIIDVLKTLEHRGKDGSLFYFKGLKETYSLEGGNFDNTGIAIGINHYNTSDKEIPTSIVELDGWKIVLNGKIGAFGLLKLSNPNQTDAEFIISYISNYASKIGPIRAIESIITNIGQSAISAIIISPDDEIFAFRDRWGIRPLYYYQNNGKFVLASETIAFKGLEQSIVKEIRPGQIISISNSGILESYLCDTICRNSFCALELAYLMSSESYYDGMLIRILRERLGQELARELINTGCMSHFDFVIGVPKSGIPAAKGFANVLGVDLVEALVINPEYYSRSFMCDKDETRKQSATDKFLLASDIDLFGKSVAVVDDSLFRGTVSKQISKLLKRAGVYSLEIHSASPMVLNICELGIKIPNWKDLLLTAKTMKEVEDILGVRALNFLSLSSLYRILGPNICARCFNGRGPIS